MSSSRKKAVSIASSMTILVDFDAAMFTGQYLPSVEFQGTLQSNINVQEMEM